MTAYTPCSSFARLALIESAHDMVGAVASPLAVHLVDQEHTCRDDRSSTSRGSSAHALTPPQPAGASVERHVTNDKRVRVAASGGRLAALRAAAVQLHGF